MSLSIVIPLYQEQDNVQPLFERLHQALHGFDQPWELICVDDGSDDDTLPRLQAAAQTWGAHVQIIALPRNFGQTHAMQAGIDAARGDLIATLDGDLQNDPADLPRLVQALEAQGLDLLVGKRTPRQDGWLRRWPSWLANALIARVTGVRIHDYGCSLKIYRASVIKQVRLVGEMHRFIPVWVAMFTKRIGELPVTHHPRQHGRSKYGLSRTLRVVLDLLTVFFFLHFRARPGHFFGAIGLGLGAVGSAVLLWLAWVKFVGGEDIGSRPLLLVGVLLLVFSVQCLTTGVLAEMLVRMKAPAPPTLPAPPDPTRPWKH
jgi:glycosyltransferase involved in cell wall biosynthesis